MNDEKYQSYRCRLRENKLKSLRHFIYIIKYICVQIYGWMYYLYVVPCTLDYISVDRRVKSESFSGCNIVVDGYVICGIILL